jgi:RES domain-containing protein
MIVYRLSREKYQFDLSGMGAYIAGGRWNSKGNSILYTSSSIALCLVEILVHINAEDVPDDLKLLSIEIPDRLKIKEISKSKLIEGWNNSPEINFTKEIGNQFLKENKYVGMKVPSAIVEDEFNYLFNPAHKDFKQIEIIKFKSFKLDNRLFKIKN